MRRRFKGNAVIALTLAVVLTAGAGYMLHRNYRSSHKVYVYGFSDGIAGEIGIGDTGENEGVVTAEGIRPIVLSETQTVLEVKVKEGEKIKKGQVLFTYDTTLNDLALDQKQLGIQRQKMDLESLNQDLKRIRNSVPMPEVPAEPIQKEPEVYKELRRADLDGKDYFIYGYRGDSPEEPRYCWLRSTSMVDRALLEKLCAGEGTVYVAFQITAEDEAETEVLGEYGMKLTRIRGEKVPEFSAVPDPEETEQSTEPEKTDSAETGESEEMPHASEPAETPEDKPAAPNVPAVPPAPAAPEFRYGFFDPSMYRQEQIPDLPANSGFTAQELSQMKKEKQKEIDELEKAIHVAESEYKVMEMEASSGQVLAESDGTVVELRTPEEAKEKHEPLMRVSSGGGYYVKGLVSELKMDTVHLGQEVEITVPETGEMYLGTVERLLEVPESNENVGFEEGTEESRYPYHVIVSQEAGLKEGMYVSMTPLADGTASNLYVKEAFLRKENGKVYVFALNSDGRLRKQEVTLGNGRMYDSLQVLDGITQEDFLALPFEKGVKEGTPAEEGSWETLY